ncbi:hypothetical protein [Alkalihalobacillus sp. TS-13]|uniref:hypothetical protein n=1 Tax=Alkalihalobacillus sp. TS-13 TaxID=2842455 RepID=UPI001C87CB89|nr:hypothetical protein [Alkalihalobacillus sp. TS-13]
MVIYLKVKWDKGICLLFIETALKNACRTVSTAHKQANKMYEKLENLFVRCYTSVPVPGTTISPLGRNGFDMVPGTVLNPLCGKDFGSVPGTDLDLFSRKDFGSVPDTDLDLFSRKAFESVPGTANRYGQPSFASFFAVFIQIFCSCVKTFNDSSSFDSISVFLALIKGSL